MKRFVLLLLSMAVLVPDVFANGVPIPPPRALPEGAVMRISNRNITRSVFSPDSTQLAVVCTYSGIWIFDGRTGDELALLTGHTDTITTIAYSPDGKTIASGSLDKTVRLWDTQTFELRATLEGHDGNTNVFAFSPDSKHLATGASHQVFPERLPRGRFHIEEPIDEESQPEKVMDGRVRLWDVATGELIKTMLTTNDGWVNRLVYASDDVSLICVSTDGIYRIWNTETGQDKKFDTNYPHGNLTFSSDGTRFVQKMKEEIILCDADTGVEVATLESGPDSRFMGFEFSQNGETVMTFHQEQTEIRVFDTRTGQLRSRIPISPPVHQSYHGSSAMSPDGKILALQADHKKGDIQLLDTQTGYKLFNLSVNTNVRSLHFSPDGRTLAMMSSKRDNNRDYGLLLRLWNVKAKTETGSIEFMHTLGRSDRGGFVTAGKGGTLACGVGGSNIWLFDANSGKYLSSFKGHSTLVNSAAVSYDGTMLASSDNNATVNLWDTRTTKKVGMLVEKYDHKDIVPQVYAVAFSLDGLTLASVSKLNHASQSRIQLWRVDTEKHQHTLGKHPNGVSAIAFSPDRSILASSGNNDTVIRLWDIQTRKLKDEYIGHTAGVSALAYSPDGKLLASGGGYNDTLVQIWNTTTGENHALHDAHARGVTSLAFSQDGTLLASGGEANIEVWDIQFRQHKATLKGHRQRISSLAFIGDENILASASYDQTIVLWKPISTVDRNVVLNITPSSVVSPEIGKQHVFKIQIAGSEKVAAYQFTLQYDTSALQYISVTNGDYLPEDAIFLKPVIENGQITLTSTALTGEVSGDGTLAAVTFEVVDVKTSTLGLHNASLSDRSGNRIRPTVKSGKVEVK